MGIQDLIITPIYLILFTLLALFIRPYVTNAQTKRYFLPALWVRFAGAIALGLVYQFYYGGGDTFNFHSQAGVIYEAFIENPLSAFRLIFKPYESDADLFEYTSQMYWYYSTSEYTVIRFAGLLSILTLNSYIGVSLFFAFYSFTGSWCLFRSLYQKFPYLKKEIMIGTLLVPSVIFWGSGVMKDTLTLGSLGIAFYFIFQWIENKKTNLTSILIVIATLLLIYLLKFYVLLVFIPSVAFWWYRKNIQRIRNRHIRLVLAPFLGLIFLIAGYLLVDALTINNDRYRLNSLAKWSYITSYDIRYWTGREAGSGYDLGTQDGTILTLLKLAPAGINVSLFRPYIWEVRNPLMLMSAIESSILLLFAIRLIVVSLPNASNRKLLSQPLIQFMIVFSLVFAFAVGVSTYNFGTLSRYKVPLMPFFVTLLLVLNSYGKRVKYGTRSV